MEMRRERKRYRFGESGRTGQGPENPYRFGTRRRVAGDISFRKIVLKVLPWALALGIAYWLVEEFVLSN